MKGHVTLWKCWLEVLFGSAVNKPIMIMIMIIMITIIIIIIILSSVL